MEDKNIIPIRAELDLNIKTATMLSRRVETGAVAGFLGQATTILLWVAGFFALVQTMSFR